MNKKLVALTTSLIVGGTLLGTTVFASSNESAGYETYKSALFNMHNVKSLTDTIKISAADNGASLISANATLKINREGSAASGKIDIKAGNTEKEREVYKQGDKAITKDGDSDIYNVIDVANGQAKWQERKPDEALIEKRAQNLENIVDALIGNKKNYFVLSNNSDGTKTVNVKLSENQVLPVANAVVSAIIRGRGTEAVNEAHAQSKIDVEIPKLVKDISITNIDVTAVINSENVIVEQKGTITISGKDISGVEHNLVLSIDMNISNLNSTTPDTVNLDGKQVKTVTPEAFKQHK